VKNGQGKNLGWMTVKSAILKAVIDGRNTREKLKADFTPHIVSTKDIDYHLRGTPNKPGLIMRGVLKEKNGILMPNLQREKNLREILKDYLLSFPEYEKALKVEFSFCFLSESGDLPKAVHNLTEKQKEMLHNWASNDWPHGERPHNNEEMEGEIREMEDEIIKLAEDLSQKTRGHLEVEDKISYIIAFYSLFSTGPFQEYRDQQWWKNYEEYGRWELSEITLSFKDMRLIHETAKKAGADIIKMVFDRLRGIATRNLEHNIFPGSRITDIGEALFLITKEMYKNIDKLIFDISLYDSAVTIGCSFGFKREIVNITKLQGRMLLQKLERLGQILKDFNNSQEEAIRQSMDDVEKEPEKYYGKLL